MTRFFGWVVRNPLVANLLSFCLLLGGAGAYLAMPQEYLPPINLKWAVVVVPYPGVAAADIEQVITRPVEEELEDVDYINQLNSRTTEGRVEFSIQFENISLDEFERQFQEVHQAVDRVDLPGDALDPFYFKIKSSNFIPLVQISVTGDEHISYHQLRQRAKDLGDRLDDFWEVDQVLLFDSREREIHVAVDPVQARAHGLDLNAIAAAVAAQNVDLPAGPLTLGATEVLVRSTDQYRSLDDIAATVVRPDPLGSHLTLRQVAQVRDTYARERARSRLDGRRCVTMGITKKDVGSSLELLAKVRAELALFQSALPPGVRVELVNDTSIRIENALVNLQTNALLGLVLVIFVLWLFIGLRNSAMAAVGIPVAFALSFVLLHQVGASVNENTLFGLVLVLGMVVDDAIVVIENIYRYLQAGYRRAEAVVEGCREVVAPVLTSILTTIAAFMPLVLLPGTIGEFLKVVPITVSLVLVASLFECFFILPSHVADYGSGGGHSSLLDNHMRRLTRAYERTLAALLPSWRRYALVFGIMALIFAAAAVVFPRLRQELFSSDPQSYFVVWLTMPEGTALDATERRTQQIEEAIRAMPGPDRDLIEHILVNTGVQNTESEGIVKPNYAELIVDVRDGPEMKETLERMVDYARRAVDPLRQGTDNIRIKVIENGPPKDFPLEAKIQGDDYAVLDEIARRLKERLATFPGLVNQGDDYNAGKGELHFRLNGAEAHRLGLNAAAVGQALSAALKGQYAGTYRDDDEEIDILVRYDEAWFSSGERLGDIEVRTPAGHFVKLSSVAALQRTSGPSDIKRRDFKRTVTVYAEERPDSVGATARATRMLQEYFQDELAPAYPGYRLVFGGQFKEFDEAFDNILLLFGFGVMTIFFILVLQFRSLIQPLIILMTIPFALAGALVGLVVNDFPLSITVIYGMVGLSGVVINDSIVLISFINAARRNGQSLKDAILEGGNKRLRPIILTTVTTVGGVLPIALGLTGKSAVWSPLATLIIFGLVTATSLMLVVTPCLYHMVEDVRYVVWEKLGLERLNQTLRQEVD